MHKLSPSFQLRPWQCTGWSPWICTWNSSRGTFSSSHSRQQNSGSHTWKQYNIFWEAISNLPCITWSQYQPGFSQFPGIEPLLSWPQPIHSMKDIETCQILSNLTSEGSRSENRRALSPDLGPGVAMCSWPNFMKPTESSTSMKSLSLVLVTYWLNFVLARLNSPSEVSCKWLETVNRYWFSPYCVMTALS